MSFDTIAHRWKTVFVSIAMIVSFQVNMMIVAFARVANSVRITSPYVEKIENGRGEKSQDRRHQDEHGKDHRRDHFELHTNVQDHQLHNTPCVHQHTHRCTVIPRLFGEHLRCQGHRDDLRYRSQKNENSQSPPGSTCVQKIQSSFETTVGEIKSEGKNEKGKNCSSSTNSRQEEFHDEQFNTNGKKFDQFTLPWDTQTSDECAEERVDT
jgi:hypothetical protein